MNTATCRRHQPADLRDRPVSILFRTFYTTSVLYSLYIQICYETCEGDDYTHFGTEYGKEVRSGIHRHERV